MTWTTENVMDEDKKDGHFHLSSASRPVRTRRYARKHFTVAGVKPQKRLFTPEIKRYLKDWLVRRRENPYPNREEKKNLARETGLTYIQICNWFANWRRKLKNVNFNVDQDWGQLIKTYNDRANGNVEQFSITSDDSIWSESQQETENDEYNVEVTDNTELKCDEHLSSSSIESNDNVNNNNIKVSQKISSPILLSKWLESAARFQPSENNYYWWVDEKRQKNEDKIRKTNNFNTWIKHDRDEMEAAVALTALATSNPVSAL